MNKLRAEENSSLGKIPFRYLHNLEALLAVYRPQSHRRKKKKKTVDLYLTIRLYPFDIDKIEVQTQMETDVTTETWMQM
jgi:hypothetical protein